MLRKGMLYPAQPPADVPEKEYICKDALLEWAEEMKDAWEDYADTSYYQEFIDKINSM